jgi:hypothetical protein
LSRTLWPAIAGSYISALRYADLLEVPGLEIESHCAWASIEAVAEHQNVIFRGLEIVWHMVRIAETSKQTRHYTIPAYATYQPPLGEKDIDLCFVSLRHRF